MSRRAGFAALLAVVAVAGCGSDEGEKRGSGGLSWVQAPLLVVPDTLPNDRIVSGVMRNDSLRQIRLKTSDVRLLDRGGKRIVATVGFIQGYLHSNFPPTREPVLPQSELRRLGRIAAVEPGKTVPLTVSWRQPAGSRRPARIVVAGGSLPLPTKRAPRDARLPVVKEER